MLRLGKEWDSVTARLSADLRAMASRRLLEDLCEMLEAGGLDYSTAVNNGWIDPYPGGLTGETTPAP